MEGAEARYRAALARRPNLGTATSGLYEVLQQQGRFAEAEALQGKASRAASEASGNAARANQLRTEAQTANDPEDQILRLRQAVELDPGSSWARLDLARALSRQGQQVEARALMEPPAGTTNADALYAAALFAEEDGRAADSAGYLGRIPARLRTADMSRQLARSHAAAEVDQAASLWRSGRPAEARAALIAIAARPDPSGGGSATAIRVLGGLGDRAGAAEAGRAAMAANPNAPAAARLAVGSALLGAGAEQEALQIARSVGSQPNLSAEDRRQAAALQAGFAIRTADRLNEQGTRPRPSTRSRRCWRGTRPTHPPTWRWPGCIRARVSLTRRRRWRRRCCAPIRAAWMRAWRRSMPPSPSATWPGPKRWCGGARLQPGRSAGPADGGADRPRRRQPGPRAARARARAGTGAEPRRGDAGLRWLAPRAIRSRGWARGRARSRGKAAWR